MVDHNNITHMQSFLVNN